VLKFVVMHVGCVFMWGTCVCLVLSVCSDFLDGYCSTVQGLLEWFEVDLGFTKLLFIQTHLCVLCVDVGEVCVFSTECVPRFILDLFCNKSKLHVCLNCVGCGVMRVGSVLMWVRCVCLA